MGIDMEEWPKKTKIKILLSYAVIIAVIMILITI
jgi:hypothetical protein